MVAGRAEPAVTGGAVLKAALAGAARRLTQTLVIFVVLTMATTAALVGLTLASDPTLSFRAVSARYHTADLAVTIDATKVTSAQLARTHHLPGVTGAVGYPATTVSITVPLPPKYRDEGPAGPITVVGRASRSGQLDEIIETHGRWFTRLGEMDQNELSGRVAPLGLVITGTVTSLASKPKLTIVGRARLGARRTIRKRPGRCRVRSPPWKRPARPGRNSCSTPSGARPPSPRSARTWANCGRRCRPGRSSATPSHCSAGRRP